MKSAAITLLASCLVLPATLCGTACSPPPPAPATKTVAYDVGGMHCGGCADAITAEVSHVQGVKGVACTIETRRAVVELADAAAEPAAEKAITKLGYTITKVAPDAPLSAEAQAAADAKKAAEAAKRADEAAGAPDGAPAQPAAEPSSR